MKSERSNVVLQVYDILGNEVATLVDEYKPAGSYEVEFDASKLSSGVYFYQLKTGEFIQTRKMILNEINKTPPSSSPLAKGRNEVRLINILIGGVMKINLLVLLFIGFALSLSDSFPQEDTFKKPDYYKVSKVKIFINDDSDILELRKQGISVEHIKIYEDNFEAFLDSFQINTLKKSGYQFEIIIDDVTKDYLERTKEFREKTKLKKPCKLQGFGYGSMGGFYTFDEVVAQLDTMRLLYPNLITEKDSIGSTIEGRTIWAVKISDNPEVKENEPRSFL